MIECKEQPAFKMLPMLAVMMGVGAVVWLIGILLDVVLGEGVISRIDVSIIAGLTLFATMITMWPVALLGSRGVMPTVAGYLIGTGVRMVISLAVALVAVTVYEVTAGSLLAGMVLMYLALMAVEAYFVGRYLWQKDELAIAAGESMEISA